MPSIRSMKATKKGHPTPDGRLTVARRVRRLRIKAGLTCAQLARETGYTRAAISLMERTGGITEQGRRVLALRFGVDPEHFRP